MGATGGTVRATLCVAFLLYNVSNLRTVSATTFSVENRAPTTPGGIRYADEMGDAWTIQMLGDVSKFIVEALSPSYRPVDHLTFIVKEQDDRYPAYHLNNEIHVDVDYLASKEPGTLRFEVKGLMFHEVCHAFQNFGGDYRNDKHFTGVIEGIATYMELVAGYGVGPKEKGGTWYTGYHHTAHFFAWIDETHTKQFVNLLNQRMGQQAWNDDFFIHLTGKYVDDLWALYQNSF